MADTHMLIFQMGKLSQSLCDLPRGHAGSGNYTPSSSTSVTTCRRVPTGRPPFGHVLGPPALPHLGTAPKPCDSWT